ncbi:MAG: type I methionyl aminopeptidase [Kiritimatiellae bacterium]|nr:type I methionyl aminopeptidase [Kiritimatiellia bacterium]
MIIIKSQQQLAQMRGSCRIAAIVRDTVARKVGPGVTTRELDEYAEELIGGFGAKSAFLGYRGYPGHVCISVNAEVVHGIPGARRIRLGDIVSIDIGVRYDGYVGDTATTVMVGVTDPEVMRLVQTTEEALYAGIEKARPNAKLFDISHAIESTAVGGGFAVVREFVGHGIGREMHEEPQIPNFGEPGRGPRLKPGMTFAIEPMVNLGGAEVEVLADGWTVLTRDRKPSAHFEHTIAVREGRAEVLTQAEEG